MGRWLHSEKNQQQSFSPLGPLFPYLHHLTRFTIPRMNSHLWAFKPIRKQLISLIKDLLLLYQWVDLAWVDVSIALKVHRGVRLLIAVSPCILHSNFRHCEGQLMWKTLPAKLHQGCSMAATRECVVSHHRVSPSSSCGINSTENSLYYFEPQLPRPSKRLVEI